MTICVILYLSYLVLEIWYISTAGTSLLASRQSAYVYRTAGHGPTV
jgi:hypothetical protein